MAKEKPVAKETQEAREVVPRKPIRGISRFRGEIDRLFDELIEPRVPMLRRWPELFHRWAFGEWDAGPALDVYEEKDAIVVRADLPGMEKADIHVDVSGDMLTVRGEKKKEERVEEDDYYCRERAYGAFRRSVRLPVEVEADKASASFQNGVLEMRLPKPEAAKRHAVSIDVQ